VKTVWILGDQLNRGISSLTDPRPADARIPMAESEAKLASKAWHRQRLPLVLASMRRFARELEAEGFQVDFAHASSLASGLAQHRRRHAPEGVRAMEPMSWDGLRLLQRLDGELVRSNQFLCHQEEFAEWARGQRRLCMEDFYRWQRDRHGFLMDGAEPAGGRWNFDEENRAPPPGRDVSWRPPPPFEARPSRYGGDSGAPGAARGRLPRPGPGPRATAVPWRACATSWPTTFRASGRTRAP